MPGPPNTDAAIDLQLAWREGARALREGRAAEALGLFRQIVSAGQATSAVWIGVAMAHRGLGETADERAALDEALRLDPRDLRALIMTADHHAAAGDARAADSYYAAFAKLAEAAGDPALQAEAARARSMQAQYAASYETLLRSQLSGFALDRPEGRRMQRSLDLMLGKSEIYPQQPRNFYFPELPQIEYADRDAFPWLDRVEAATADIRAELVRVLEDDAGAFSPYVEAEPNRPTFDGCGEPGAVPGDHGRARRGAALPDPGPHAVDPVFPASAGDAHRAAPRLHERALHLPPSADRARGLRHAGGLADAAVDGGAGLRLRRLDRARGLEPAPRAPARRADLRRLAA
jgi:hypothetical protein